MVAAPVCIHTNSGVLASTFLLTFHFFSFVLLILAILTGVEWNFIVVLICICLIAKNAKHVYRYLLFIFISSLEKSLFRSLSFFFWLNSLLVFHYTCECFRINIFMIFILLVYEYCRSFYFFSVFFSLFIQSFKFFILQFFFSLNRFIRIYNFYPQAG